MPKVTVELSDEMKAEVERICSRLGIPIDEFIRQAVAQFLRTARESAEFKPIGFGMWSRREDMGDSAQWVRKLREQMRKFSP